MDHESVMDAIRLRLGERADDYILPPPCFVEMRGEFIAFDSQTNSLTARFPVLDQQRNPYGSMQGGFIAAAVDNTVGPLSMLVAPPNFTRRLDMKYSRAVTAAIDLLTVTARLEHRKGPQLTFRAEVFDRQQTVMASARAVHWIVEPVDAS